MIEIRCSECGKVYRFRKPPLWCCGKRQAGGIEVADVPARPKVSGPGTELKQLIASLGLTRKAGCGCDEMIARMNAWGIAGCREHRAEIVEHLAKAYDAATTLDKLLALGNTLWQRGPLTLDGLLDEAIRRAEASATN